MDSSQHQRGAFDIDTYSEIGAWKQNADVHGLDLVCRVHVLAPSASALSFPIVVVAAG
jgi:hypothetical protein